MTMRKLILSVFLFLPFAMRAQDLPVGFTPRELDQLQSGNFQLHSGTRGITTPPVGSHVRAMAEWEEIQALTIAWTSYPDILKQIVAAAVNETKVIILTDDVTGTQNYLTSANTGGPAISMDNVILIDALYNSIWMRDYAANPVYKAGVDSLVLVDWIYNRPSRPDDDASPQYIADQLNLDLYSITQAPTDLVNTGGNWMSDGAGTAFASKLILDENNDSNPYGVTPKSESDIDAIAHDFLGIDRYIKMETLPYDGIHHIDMHMKLIDEETLLVGQYPDGVADGPQINANIEYVLANYQSLFGTPYKVIRIPMPDAVNGTWPSDNPPASYRTYTNAVFVNKTVILPTYRTEFDTTALRIWREALPGFNIVGIDCDNSGNNIIAQSGAIHCITHSVGVEDPMLIVHQPLSDTDNTIQPYIVAASIQHRSGIQSASLFWKTSINDPYQEVALTALGNDQFQGAIPPQPVGTVIYYYIEGQSVSGKIQVRPMSAPAGYWHFKILGVPANIEESTVRLGKVFPNPASSITCIETSFSLNSECSIALFDVSGREVRSIYNGSVAAGDRKFFIDVAGLESGIYVIRVSAPGASAHQPLVVR